MARLIYFLCILLLFGCQTDISSKDQEVKGNSDLKTSDGVLDLSQFSQEQQKVEREQAAMRREELKAGRVVLEANHKEKIKRGLVLSEAISSPPFVPLNNKLAVKNTIPTSIIHSPSLVKVEYKRTDGAMLVIKGLGVDAVAKLINDFDRRR